MLEDLEDKIKQQGIEVPLKWHIPDSIITRYAHNMVIQALENEFKISFFEVKPEIRISEDSPIPKESIAECVASIIVSPAKLPKFIEALQKHLDRFTEK